MNRINQLFSVKTLNVLNIYCTAGYPHADSLPIILQALQIGSPPTWKDVPEEFQTDLASLDRLDDDSLWQIARSQKTQLEMERYESLLSKQQNAALTDSEKLELDNLRKDSDRFMLRKSQAAAILKWRGHNVSRLAG